MDLHRDLAVPLGRLLDLLMDARDGRRDPGEALRVAVVQCQLILRRIDLPGAVAVEATPGAEAPIF